LRWSEQSQTCDENTRSPTAASAILGLVTHKDDEHGRFIYYAYRSDGRVYGGWYEVGDSDCDFSFNNPGDAVNVI